MLNQIFKISGLLSILFTLVITSLPAAATINDAEAINKAGRQRMLSQRIAKSYIMIGSDVNPDQATADLDTSMALFEQQFLELMDYAPDDKIRNSLNDAAITWQEFRLKVLETPTREKALTILALSDELLARSETVVKAITEHAGHKAGQLVNISGRQRMLSQRIAKLYITRAWGVKDPSVVQSLDLAIDEFGSALTTLRQSELNSSDIKQKLAKVQSQWDFTNAGFKISHQGHFVPTMVSVTTESILKKMNDLTYDYEQLMIKSND
ncbi:type IV pili methyl-accepting chemotaxis transducer N-terminal domain-containing protein [Endozoicomonas sp. ALB115]|uniref:type IV pili methyl-accepting chemotaxis transducer N-terminal domain-containing protein n=1 Tax=Endozoicomonas sp. ALB115 TaxID=3403074 RepID=UPI003BB7F0E1